ncbi:phytanoyl-CoA dioxygenase family protein [Paenibacillus elgii]|uniref:phytanoyl-CoA dioxygenase family protein n=1 Tax=Paenibacillus elgii TaxID=189691 RepID=UPI002D7A9BCF|nr:phytanoyl-CoA dioxygenase family protein [Paenibacillus elgii]
MTQSLVRTKEKAFFEEQGYLVVRGAYDPEQLEEISAEYLSIWLGLLASGEIVQHPDRPLESLYPNRLRDFHRGNEKIVKFMLEPRVIATLEELIGEEPVAVQSSYYYKPPGTRGLGYHQDNYHIGVWPGTSYAVWVSIDPADEENGSLLFVPGTQKLDLVSAEVLPGSCNAYGSEVLCVPEGYEPVQIRTSPGDVVIFNGNIYHGSTRNKSAYRYRRSFVTHFAGASLEKVTLNYGYLVDKHGGRVRRKLNSSPKIIEMQQSIFTYKDTALYDQYIKRN